MFGFCFLFSLFQNTLSSVFLLFSHCIEIGVCAVLIHSPLLFAWVRFINPSLPTSWPSGPSTLSCFAVSWVSVSFASLLFSKVKLNTALSAEALGKTVRPLINPSPPQDPKGHILLGLKCEEVQVFCLFVSWSIVLIDWDSFLGWRTKDKSRKSEKPMGSNLQVRKACVVDSLIGTRGHT